RAGDVQQAPAAVPVADGRSAGAVVPAHARGDACGGRAGRAARRADRPGGAAAARARLPGAERARHPAAAAAREPRAARARSALGARAQRRPRVLGRRRPGAGDDGVPWLGAVRGRVVRRRGDGVAARAGRGRLCRTLPARAARGDVLELVGARAQGGPALTMGAGSAPLLVIVGPTASGKTELAVQVAEASNGEIVSADSVQVYRGFDIGSGKPSAEQRRRAPHHLIDVCDPLDAMDAARWAALAEASISDIVSRGRRPIVCGGTYLWVRALIFGLAAAPPGDPTLRAQHRALVDAEGRAALHARLAAADPQAAARLSPNDFVRVSRALEVL